MRDVEVVFDAPDPGVGRAAQLADDRRLPVRHPRGPAPPRARRCSTSTTSPDPDRRPAPAAAPLQAVLPGHGLDPAARGRAPAAVGPAALLPEVRRAARRRADRAAGRARAAGPDHDRAAAAGGPRLRRRLVGAGRRAQAVDRRRGQHAAGHRPAVPDRTAGRGAAARQSRWLVRLAHPGDQEPQRGRAVARGTDGPTPGAESEPRSRTPAAGWQASSRTRAGSRGKAASGAAGSGAASGSGSAETAGSATSSGWDLATGWANAMAPPGPRSRRAAAGAGRGPLDDRLHRPRPGGPASIRPERRRRSAGGRSRRQRRAKSGGRPGPRVAITRTRQTKKKP